MAKVFFRMSTAFHRTQLWRAMRIVVAIAAIFFAPAAILGVAPAKAYDADNWPVCLNRSQSYTREQKIDACTALIQSAQEVPGNVRLAYFNRGNAYLDEKDYDRAIADYDMAIGTGSKIPALYNNRGYAYHAKGDDDRAVADFNQALAINPRHNSAYTNLGIIFYAKGDYDRAITSYSAALAINPNDAYPLYGRGLAKWKTGDSQGGSADIQRAKSIKADIASAFAAQAHLPSEPAMSGWAIGTFIGMIILAVVGVCLAFGIKRPGKPGTGKQEVNAEGETPSVVSASGGDWPRILASPLATAAEERQTGSEAQAPQEQNVAEEKARRVQAEINARVRAELERLGLKPDTAAPPPQAAATTVSASAAAQSTAAAPQWAWPAGMITAYVGSVLALVLLAVWLIPKATHPPEAASPQAQLPQAPQSNGEPSQAQQAPMTDRIVAVAKGWGVPGTWRSNCNSQPTPSNPSFIWAVTADDRILFNKQPDRETSPASVTFANLHEDGSLVLWMDSPSSTGPTLELAMVRLDANHIQIVSSREVGTNAYSIADRMDVRSGNKVPILTRCD